MIKKEVTDVTGAIYIIYERKFICSCGFKGDSNYQTCPSCKTSKIGKVDQLNKKGRVRIDAILDVIEKDDRSFHISKKELYGHVEEEDGKEVLKLRYDKYFEMKWSLKDQLLEIYRNGKLVEDEKRYASFFRGITHTEVLNVISTENNRFLLKFAFEEFGRNYNERTERLDRALIRLFKYPMLELFNFAGFGHLLSDIKRIASNSKETKPNKILGVPKYMMNYLKKLSSLNWYTIGTWLTLDKKYGGTNVKMILEMLDEESSVDKLDIMSDYYTQLVDEYGYSNHKRLMIYLTREIKLQQGIADPVEGARLLRDYCRMYREIGKNPEKREKYSRNLKKDHDVTMMNYRMLQDLKKIEEFKQEMEKPIWDEILYKNKNFIIVKPEQPQDLVDEGETLGHCVASYVDDVIRGSCKILFMRLTSVPDDGLITIEVRGKEKEELKVVQVKGRGNREPNASENAFIQEWAEKKGLSLAYK